MPHTCCTTHAEPAQNLRSSYLQGSKTLVLGDSRAFFAVYSIVAAVNLRAFQMDRAGGLADPQAVVEAVVVAMKDADCLLLSYEQLCLPGFPVQLFRCVIEYAPQAAMDQDSALAAAKIFKQRARLYWVAFMMPAEATEAPQSFTVPHHECTAEAQNLRESTNLGNSGIGRGECLIPSHHGYDQASNDQGYASQGTLLPAGRGPPSIESEQQTIGEPQSLLLRLE